ncbi:MAG: MerR family transcriptional regulator [Acidobacteriota bacterium]
MKQLVELSGLPRSLIHFYLREGILPAGEKTARNAATYSSRHLEILAALARLREPPLGPLPLPLQRRVIELYERGVELEVAVALEQAVLGEAGAAASDGRRYSPEELAQTAGVEVAFINELEAVGLLVPPPGERPAFDANDLQIVTLCRDLVAQTGLPLEVARPIGDAIRQLSAYEMSLRNRAVARLDDRQAAQASLAIQQGINIIHSYLFYRWRLHDIARLREQEQSEDTP